jgi:VIT1/CCC1 family predicted Fe2+/Mn2+ transporter
VRDVILGGQDGLVNVLGLVLGLAVATGDTRIVITAALAAMFAESIAMAGVAYTASGAERDLSVQVAERLDEELRERADQRRQERLTSAAPGPVVAAAVAAADAEADAWRTELTRWRVAMAPVRETHPVRAAVVVGVATILGSAVPVVPFLLLPADDAPWVALVAAAVVLGLAGAQRARLTGGSAVRAALEMIVIGLTSAFAGYLIGQLLRVPA